MRTSYKRKEDWFIIRYIHKKKEYDRVKGTTIWKALSLKMEEKGYARTWQSLRERYIKNIIPRIHEYKISNEEITKFLRPFGEQYAPKQKREVTGPRKTYSRDDDKVLVEAVLRESGVVKGNLLWQKLEEANILPGRTWESMRNRFLKTTSKHLGSFLSENKRQAILKRINGDLSFVVYPKEAIASTSRACSMCLRERCTCAARPSSPPGSSTSTSEDEDRPILRRWKTRSTQFRARISSSSSSESHSSHSTRTKSSSSSSSFLRASPPKENDSVLEEASSAGEVAGPGEAAPRQRSSSSPSASTASRFPVVRLERCDRKIPEEIGTKEKAPPTIHSATTQRFARVQDCCCDDFGSDQRTGRSEMAPCGSDCRYLNAEKYSPSPKRRNYGLVAAVPDSLSLLRSNYSNDFVASSPPSGSESSERAPATDPCPKTTAGVRQLSGWLCKPTRSTSDFSDIIECSVEKDMCVQIKVELPDSDENPEEEMCESSDEEESEFFVDDLYREWYDGRPSYTEVNGAKFSLGPLPFPFVSPAY